MHMLIYAPSQVLTSGDLSVRISVTPVPEFSSNCHADTHRYQIIRYGKHGSII